VRPGDALIHPVPLLSLATLIVNDHWAKHAHPSVLTGKLSDVAGLIFFPLLLQALIEIVSSAIGRFSGHSRRLLAISIFGTAILFSLAKTCPMANEAVRMVDASLRYPLRFVLASIHHAPRPALGRPSLVLDPTDLLALPALAIAFVVGNRRRRDAIRNAHYSSSVEQVSST
jgi:hypothetical protein